MKNARCELCGMLATTSVKDEHGVTTHYYCEQHAPPLAAGVLAGQGIVLAPAFGALLMSASTVIVAANAQLLRGLDL